MSLKRDAETLFSTESGNFDPAYICGCGHPMGADSVPVFFQNNFRTCSLFTVSGSPQCQRMARASLFILVRGDHYDVLGCLLK